MSIVAAGKTNNQELGQEQGLLHSKHEASQVRSALLVCFNATANLVSPQC